VNLEQRIQAAERDWAAQQALDVPKIYIGSATCGLAAGADELLERVDGELASLGIEARVLKVGCIGMCFAEPLVDIQLPGQPRVAYASITGKKLPRILKRHLVEGEPHKKYVFGTLGEGSLAEVPRLEELPVLGPQIPRIALRNAGRIDPTSLDDYLAQGGYKGLLRALDMKPEEVIQEVKDSQLRGRGGAGFPTGLKWTFCRNSPGDHKYLVCNADEGDPGAFMDRSVLESDPHAVLEGMCIAAYAIGTDVAYIYIRAEYPLAIQRLRNAIDQMHEVGLLGENILGTGFDFEIRIKEGAGAFVCGEETALIASIEGERGMPRSRPPFPAVRGLFGKPTNVNNVETLANVSSILREGASWFAELGSGKSRGTKTFALAGKVNKPGLIEVPMGVSLRQVVYDVGGGIPKDRPFKAAQTGGPSGGCLPEAYLDTPIEYETLAEAGSIMGSGGLVIMDDMTCMVDVARYFLSFTQNESCGKCTPCRVGTRLMLGILDRICAGQGEAGDIETLEELGEAIKATSLCGLGQTAPNPVLTTLKHFRSEYEAHIHQQKCPGKTCKDLITFTIDQDKCTGCRLCVKQCSVDAIAGTKKKPHTIDQDLCIQCGACFDVCRDDAVVIE
jgi:NADH:ubiquinone oxidoreductase subunit F (NADH-binding)/(2Fe-2S) ferredoxin